MLDAALQLEAIPSTIVPGVSTAVGAVLQLAIGFFFLYTALFIARTYNQYTGADSSPLEKVLSSSTYTFNYAPMLAVLFLAIRLVAIQISDNEPDKHNLPQPWAKTSILVAVWSLYTQLFTILLTPVVEIVVDRKVTDGLFATIRYLAGIAQLAAVIVVVYAIGTMEVPGVKSTVPAAVECVAILTITYFVVIAVQDIARTYNEYGADAAAPATETFTSKLQAVFALGAETMSLAPMLAILILAARLRSNQIGLPQPQWWAIDAFYFATYGVIALVAITVALPLLFGSKVKRGTVEGDVTFEITNATGAAVLTFLRYALVALLYGSYTAIVVSISVIEAKSGPTPAVSTAVQNVIYLVSLYFFVYVGLWALLSWKTLSGAESSPIVKQLIQSLTSAKLTVAFAPMLAVLYIGARMRALQISKNQAGPQYWAQYSMTASTVSIFVQLVLLLLEPIIGSADDQKIGVSITGTILNVLRYAALLGVYGGATAVATSIFLIDSTNVAGAREGIIPNVVPEIPNPLAF